MTRSSYSIGWLAASVRSIMLRRLCPSHTGMSIHIEELSGPRCRIDSSILPKSLSPSFRPRAGSIMPAMPHIGGTSSNSLPGLGAAEQRGLPLQVRSTESADLSVIGHDSFLGKIVDGERRRLRLIVKGL